MIKISGLSILLALFFGFCGENRTGNSVRRPETENRAGNSAPPSDEKYRTGDSAQRFYGEKIMFWQNQPIRFADFNLTYTGERQVSSDRFPNGIRYRDFRVKSAAEEQTFSWSSETRETAPVSFSVGGKNYELELKMSGKLGKLAPNELVVWEK